jgi:hypothetical protein
MKVVSETLGPLHRPKAERRRFGRVTGLSERRRSWLTVTAGYGSSLPHGGMVPYRYNLTTLRYSARS